MGKVENSRPGEPISGKLAVCAFVEKLHLFKGLAKEDLNHLYQTGRLVACKAGEVVFREGDRGSDLLLLMSGSVRVTADGKEGKLELGQLSRGAVLGEVGVLTGRPRTATVTAVDEVEFVAFGRRDLEGILRKYPRVRKLMKAMVEARVRRVIEKVKS